MIDMCELSPINLKIFAMSAPQAIQHTSHWCIAFVKSGPSPHANTLPKTHAFVADSLLQG